MKRSKLVGVEVHARIDHEALRAVATAIILLSSRGWQLATMGSARIFEWAAGRWTAEKKR